MNKIPIKIPTFEQEQIHWNLRLQAVAGVDEAGRGPWAGPVHAAAVSLPKELGPVKLKGLTDSKLLTSLARDRWFDRIQELAASWGIAKTEASDIDLLGIVPATKKAMLSAITSLKHCNYLLCDAMSFTAEDATLLPPGLREMIVPLISQQQSFIRGEQVSLSIAAASVLAKVSRDREMVLLDEQYPQYGFAKHKGYGTKEHQVALLRYGPCPLHRTSFKPIKHLLEFGL